jgi:PleD family two-component response regulator
MDAQTKRALFAGRRKMAMEQRYVLVVEDDASMSQAIERLLRAAGFQAHVPFGRSVPGK